MLLSLSSLADIVVVEVIVVGDLLLDDPDEDVLCKVLVEDGSCTVLNVDLKQGLDYGETEDGIAVVDDQEVVVDQEAPVADEEGEVVVARSSLSSLPRCC